MADRTLSVRLRQSAPIPIDVEFNCAPGAVLAIFGPSGSGKTTILRAIAGLTRPATAVVRSGQSTWIDTERDLFLPPHRRRVGMVFQDYALFPHLTTVGNVMTALAHVPRSDRRRQAEQLLASVHLASHYDQPPAKLSGGERQRVALARALARQPDVLLLDEPFAATDRGIRRRLQDEIDSLRRTLEIPLVLVTHDFDDVVRLASHLLILEMGRGVASGALEELTSRPDLPWLRAAVGLGSVFEAVVARSDSTRGLVELVFDGGVLLASDSKAVVGSTVRVRIPAREVILATSAPGGLSLHNALPATVTAVHADPAFEHVIVQVAVGATHLLSEVTRDAIARLSIEPGSSLHVLIKSVSIELAVTTRR